MLSCIIRARRPSGHPPWPQQYVEQLSVHPRACGEQLGASAGTLIYYGSSPRLRGTVAHRVTGNRRRRFIPAPAGNRPKTRHTCPRLPVHPRACGEQFVESGFFHKVSDGSPRAFSSLFRFIPAPAGNSGSPGYWSVHPRACGEQAGQSFSAVRTDGSSPRLRGTGKVSSATLSLFRFIPAPAGNSGSPGYW